MWTWLIFVISIPSLLTLAESKFFWCKTTALIIEMSVSQGDLDEMMTLYGLNQ